MPAPERRKRPWARGIRGYHIRQGGVLFLVLYLTLLPSLRTARSRAVLGDPLETPIYAPTGFVYKDEAFASERWKQSERAIAIPLQAVPKARLRLLEEELRGVVANPALLSDRISPEDAAVLQDPARRDRIGRALESLLARIEAYGILQKIEDPEARYRVTALGETRILTGKQLLSFNRLEDHLTQAGANVDEARALAEVIRLRFLPTLLPDEEAWEAITQRIRDEIPVPEIRPEPGALLIQAGKPVTQEDLRLLEALSEYQRQGRYLPALGLAGYLLLALLGAAFYLQRYQEKSWATPRRTAAFGVAIAVTALLVLVVQEITARHLPTPWGFRFTPALWPVSLAAMSLALFFGSRGAFLASTLLSLGFVLAYSPRIEIATMFLFGNLVAARVAVRVRHRSDLVRAAALTAGTHCAALVSMGLIRGLGPELLAEDVVSAVISPFLAASLIHPLLSGLEWISGKASVFRLLELTDLDHPLLRRMLREAPGTFQHSQHVALLAEAGADAIGANSLLCRVGGYFHDIGKLRRPEYFTENAQGDANPHNELKPSLSADILKAHIANGLADGREANLPEEVLAFIPEHHGTTMMEYFYYKALQEAGEEGVDRFAFTYDGPRPQTRETALLMLADSVEATSRALVKPSVSKIERTVRKIVNQKFIDGQLDESPLTLADLNRVAESFTHVLAGMHHARSVDYPEKEEIRRAEREAREGEDGQRPSERANGKHS